MLSYRGVSLKDDATTAARKRSLFAAKKSQSTPANLCGASVDTPDNKPEGATSVGEEDASPKEEIAPPPYGKVSFAITYDKELEQLRVFLEQMSQVAVKTPHATSADTFAKVSLSPDHGIPVSLTRVVCKTNSPVYRQNFIFRVTPEAVRELVIKFQVFELDDFPHNDPIGELEYPLSQNHDLDNAVTIWRDLKKPEKVPSASKGEILISLTYLPNAEKLTLVVLKARQLRLAEWRTSTPGKSVLDNFVKITLVKSGKVMKYKQTRLCRKSCNPVYNEGFALKVRQTELDDVCLTLAMCVRLNHLGFHRVVGRCIVGRHVGAEGASHWRDMIATPRSGVGQWHVLV
ncbi:synaptotagmin-1-like [Apostichopus japonicus]|uniref:synaptotagmin-1-like n=1 Tax=Stichopus japonicus TaxID=307972 RepID=UPI003AB338AE